MAEQHDFPPDFPSADLALELLSKILARSDVYSVVAELDGQVIGRNFLWEGDIIGRVGPITVVSTAQNAGIGRLLMESMLARADARRQVGVRLVQVVYHKPIAFLVLRSWVSGTRAAVNHAGTAP